VRPKGRKAWPNFFDSPDIFLLNSASRAFSLYFFLPPSKSYKIGAKIMLEEEHFEKDC